MITANSDSSDRYVTVSITLRSLQKTFSDLRQRSHSDSSDRKSLVPVPCARKTFNAGNPSIGHCCHCGHCLTTPGSHP
jgi:hypothetical protein